ncbi:MAG TPA: hypothetical protein VGE12_22980 [Noviherbaspirillum sp.]
MLRSALASAAIFLASLFAGHAAASGFHVEAVEALKAHPDAMSAVMLVRGNGTSFCTLGSYVDGNAFADNDRIAVLYAPAFRAWHGKGDTTRYTLVRGSLDALLGAMQGGICNVIVESAPNMIRLLDEMDQEGMIVSVLPSPLKPAEIADAYAMSLGFNSHAELLLASHLMASHEELQEYLGLGVTSKAAYDEAIARMQSAGYSRDPLQLLSFLKDEAEGMRRNLPATDIREERNTSTTQ